MMPSGGHMKSLIVYYSLEGNTDQTARKIAEKGDVGLLRLEPLKEYPKSGFKKFLWGGKSAVMAETPDLNDYVFDKEGYDLIIFGFPVWAGNVTPPLRTFIRDNDLKDKRIAAFACQSGAGGEKALERLKEALGIKTLAAEMILIDPKDRPDQKNEEKIERFCKELGI